jgi:hypothetical protein
VDRQREPIAPEFDASGEHFPEKISVEGALTERNAINCNCFSLSLVEFSRRERSSSRGELLPGEGWRCRKYKERSGRDIVEWFWVSSGRGDYHTDGKFSGEQLEICMVSFKQQGGLSG